MNNVISTVVSTASYVAIGTGVSKIFNLADATAAATFSVVDNLAYMALHNNPWFNELSPEARSVYEVGQILGPILVAKVITQKVTGADLGFLHKIKVTAGTLLAAVPVVSLAGAGVYDLDAYINHPSTPEVLKTAYYNFFKCINTCFHNAIDDLDKPIPKTTSFSFEFPSIEVNLKIETENESEITSPETVSVTQTNYFNSSKVDPNLMHPDL